jgi:anti-sigma regulatory factor (Ser/Thr protein kinase)
MTASLAAPETLRWKWPRNAVPPLAAIRHRLAGYLSDLGRDVVIDVQLVCTELMTNVYQHARSSGQIRIAKRDDDRVVRVEVDDDSPLIPVVPSRQPRNAKHGRGLVMVDALAKRWGVRRNPRGKTVWADVPAD